MKLGCSHATRVPRTPKLNPTARARGLAAVLLALVWATPCAAQAAGAEPESGPGNSFLRRLHLVQLEQVTRFNYMDRGPGAVTDRDIQYRLRTRLDYDLAHDGSTYLRLRAETGRGFDNSWDNTGAGRGEGHWNFHVKSLALGQRFGRFLEAQAGGIEYEQGAGTQRTYASGDGHLVGYRLLAKTSGAGWSPDFTSLTLGYAGDFAQPNLFERFHMGKLNYAQALAAKQIAKDVRVSVEADLIRDIWFTRQALLWKDVRGGLLDEFALEAVTRASDNGTFGWSSGLVRRLDTPGRWKVQLLYAHIPRKLYEKAGQPFLFNQGEIEAGKRLGWGGSFAPTRNLEIGLFGGRLLDNTPSKRWIAQVYVSYQYAPLLRRLLR